MTASDASRPIAQAATAAPRDDLERSRAAMARARELLPGGESTNARVVAGVEELVIASGTGCRFEDLDGNVYLDYLGAYGPLILGHRHPEVTAAVIDRLSRRGALFTMPHELNAIVAERVCAMVPGIELIRFANSGTEAMMSAVRLARAATGRLGVLKFAGHYHGWSDTLAAPVHPTQDDRPGVAHPIEPRSPGIPRECTAHLYEIEWNDEGLLEETVGRLSDRLAAIVCEPLMGNTGCIEAEHGFLERLRELASRHSIVLIFDEVITGFRVAAGGAQERFGVTPDLTVVAKAMGGGYPVAALGGRRDLMELFTDGRAYHGGTFAGNPIGLAGAAATLEILDRERDTIYPELYRRGRMLMDGLRESAARAGVPVAVQGPGPMFQVFVLDDADPSPILCFADARARVRKDLFLRLHDELRRRGIYVHPDQFECWFVSAAHDDDAIAQTIDASEDAFAALAAAS